MATSATPTGFKPVNLTGGRPFAGATRAIPIASAYATSIFTGDVVKLVAAGTIEKDTGTDALTPVGIFMGCSYTDADMGFIQRPYWPASTAASDAVAYVCDDPDAVFQIQSDQTVAQTALGSNFAVVQTAGSTITGISKVALDGSSSAATNTLPVRLVGFVDGPNSSVGDAKTDCLVQWVAGMHAYRNATGV